MLGEEEGKTRTLSYRVLYDLVSRVAKALRGCDIASGDVVAAFASNSPEVVIFMLAVASIGAIFTTIPPDFGPAAAQERLSQTRPKILLASASVYYNGRVHRQTDKIAQLIAAIDSIKKVVLIDAPREDPLDNLKGWIAFADLLVQSHSSDEIQFEQLPFNHPLYVLYSSGTTGKPKCLVHSAGGTLIQHLKEHRLHGDLRREDRVLQYTTIGWMMWHWLVSVLAVGGTILLYDGSPLRPDPLHLLRLVEKHQITRFGTSAKYIQHLQELASAAEGGDDLDALTLDSLKTIYSTGSPLSAANFHFVYERLKADVQLASITGGTDIISLFAGGNPLQAVHAGEIQGPALGMDIAAYSESGRDVTGVAAGDLVCRRPFPSMPVAFWGDTPALSMYRAAYFDRFPHVWHHGDFVQFNAATGGVVMLGRSDATLNPAGVRFGSAELYNVLTSFPEVADALVVGVRRGGEEDERVFMFLQPHAPLSPDAWDGLVAQIKSEIRRLLSPRHVPAVVRACPAVPYTLNGKKVEVAVKRILSAQPESSTISLANPEALEYFREVARDVTLFG